MKIKSYIQERLGLAEMISVEVILKEDDIRQYHLLHMKLSGESLQIINSQIAIDHFDELKSHLKKQTPIVLTFSGKGILLKETEHLDEEQDIVRQLLPNAKASEFCFQTYTNTKGKSFCALTRNNLVENEIKTFTDAGFFIVDFKLGCLSIADSIPLLDESENKLMCQEYKINLKGGEIQKISPNKYHKTALFYSIGGLELQRELLNCFATLFSHFVVKRELISHPLIHYQKNEFGFYTRFRLGKLIVLVASFLILLINYFLFDHYFNTSKRLQNEMSNYTQILAKKSELQEKLKNKEKNIEKLGLRNNIKFSFISDRILQKMPRSIKLQYFEIQPRKKNRKNEMLFEERKVIIKGYTPNTEKLNTWADNLKTMHWIEELIITDYTYIENKNKAEFLISIKVSNMNNTGL